MREAITFVVDSRESNVLRFVNKLHAAADWRSFVNANPFHIRRYDCCAVT